MAATSENAPNYLTKMREPYINITHTHTWDAQRDALKDVFSGLKQAFMESLKDHPEHPLRNPQGTTKSA
jgi:hypothetical protein